LAELRINEGDFSKNYLDIREHYNRATDQGIKNKIRDGLKSLRPGEPKEEEEVVAESRTVH
jgi:hypothetical protein